MNYKFIQFETKENGAAFVVMNRPEVHNAFNQEFILEMIDVFKKSAQDKKIRLIVLTGNGKSFCAGADLNWMKEMKGYSLEENIKDAKQLSLLFETINQFPKPVIARVNGGAMGGGVGLIAVCDYVIATETSALGLTETRLGLIPAVISPFVIAKIGESHARATFLSGGKFSAVRAKEMGLVHEVCNNVDLDTAVNKVVSEFLKAGPSAQCAAKELIFNLKKLNGHASVIELTTETIAKIRIGAEAQEGMSSLLEKRSPNWVPLTGDGKNA